MDIRTLINKCLGKDERAFDKLYYQYAPTFKGICRRYARSPDEADDILQEAYIKIFDSLHQLKDAKAFEGWGKRIVVNTALRHIREKKGQENTLNIDSVEESLSEEEETTSLAIMESLDITELIELMDFLPEGYKTILNLYAIEGFSHKEIAETLDIQEASSRSQYFKAKKAFQKILLDKETEQNYERFAV